MLDLVLSVGAIAVSAGCVILALQIKAMQQAQQSQQQQAMQTLQEQLQSCLSRLESHGQTHMQLVTNSAQQSQQFSELQRKQDALQQLIVEQQNKNLVQQQKSLNDLMQDIRAQLTTTLQQQNQSTNQQIAQLQKTVDEHLLRISGQVEKRLSDGFAKTNTIFTDVIKRLAMIDKAQQEINDLSSNVVSLQDILKNKQARGHFGEVQLSQLIKNCLPEKHYAFQHTFNNGKRADCVLFLPEPTGTIAIDAKFPLDNYRASCDHSDPIRQTKAKSLFKQDMKTHIKDVAEKYIITDETCQAAVLFIPAESIFADIHAQHGDLIDFAYQRKVWLVSPTTMMAILHTTQAVLKDLQTQAQVGIIKEHLQYLAEDFNRFQDRMDSVAKHISDANNKVGQVKISAQKISKRFAQIEKAEIPDQTASLSNPLLMPQVDTVES